MRRRLQTAAPPSRRRRSAPRSARTVTLQRWSGECHSCRSRCLWWGKDRRGLRGPIGRPPAGGRAPPSPLPPAVRTARNNGRCTASRASSPATAPPPSTPQRFPATRGGQWFLPPRCGQIIVTDRQGVRVCALRPPRATRWRWGARQCAGDAAAVGPVGFAARGRVVSAHQWPPYGNRTWIKPGSPSQAQAPVEGTEPG